MDTKKSRQRPKPDILTATPPGSPSWECGYHVSSVIFDALTSSPACHRTTTDDERPSASPIPSPRVNDRNDSAPGHPIDIFGTNTANCSNLMNDSRMALKPRTNKPVSRLVLRSAKPKSIVETRPTIEKASSDKPKFPIISPRARRIASKSDHPLECYTPLQLKSTIQDAEDLDLENRIRSALSRRRRPIAQSGPIIHKNVRWDPAIVSYGSPKPIPEPDSTIEKPIADFESMSLKNRSGLQDCVKTICSLKRHERFKLRELLDALSKMDSPSIVHPEPTIETKTRLNPRAPEFQALVSLRAHDRPEKLNDCNAWSTLPILKSPHRSILPPIWIRASKPISLLCARTDPVLPIVDPLPTIQKDQHISVRPTISGHSVRLLPSVAHRVSTIDLEDGHGREAKAIDPIWAKSILDRFIAMYPLTGKVKAAAPAESKGRLAAAIQQRLEYLLMQEREKKVDIKD